MITHRLPFGCDMVHLLLRCQCSINGGIHIVSAVRQRTLRQNISVKGREAPFDGFTYHGVALAVRKNVKPVAGEPGAQLAK